MGSSGLWTQARVGLAIPSSHVDTSTARRRACRARDCQPEAYRD